MTPQPHRPYDAGTLYSGHWADDAGQLLPDPTRTSHVCPEPGTRIHYGGRYPTRRHLAARWARDNRGRVVALTGLFVVLGYTATVVTFFDRALPTAAGATVLVAVGAVLVALLLSAVLWSRHE